MKNKIIKVAMVTNHFGITGIGTVMMNYCKELDKNKYDLTILAGQPISEKYEKECIQERSIYGIDDNAIFNIDFSLLYEYKYLEQKKFREYFEKCISER